VTLSLKTKIFNYLLINTLYRVIKKSLLTCFLYCNHQVRRDVLITVYILPFLPGYW